MRIHKRETCDKSKSRAFGDARVRAEKKAETRENRGAFQPERKTKEKKDELASEDSLLSLAPSYDPLGERNSGVSSPRRSVAVAQDVDDR